MSGIELPDTPAKATIRKWSERARRPAEAGVVLSAAAAGADMSGLMDHGAPTWVPIVTGILSLVIRLLPLFFKK